MESKNGEPIPSPPERGFFFGWSAEEVQAFLEFVRLAAADGNATERGIRTWATYENELNPLVRAALELAGFPGMYALGAAWILFVYRIANRTPSPARLWILKLFTLGHLWGISTWDNQSARVTLFTVRF
jgi:hypothetical protein